MSAAGQSTDWPWSEPLPPNSLENVGATELHVVSVEMKNQIQM